MFFLGLVITVAAYLIGSLSAALIVSKKFGMADPRTYGSGNPGASNVLRSGRKDAAAWTLFGDALKGLIAVLLARCLMSWLDMSPGVVAWAAIAVVAGHMWPLFFGFKGGKGVATALGVLLGMSFSTTLVVVGIWAAIAFKFKKSSLAALTAAALAPWAMFIIERNSGRPSWGWAMVVIAALVIFRHRSNIQRICQGNEWTIGETAAGTRAAATAGQYGNTGAGIPLHTPAPRGNANHNSNAADSAKQPETAAPAAATATETVETGIIESEAIDTAAADLRDGDALEEAVINEAAQQLAAPSATAQPVLTQVETQTADAGDEAEEAEKPKRGRKPRKSKTESESSEQ